MYIHELENWPEFRWGQSGLTDLLADVRHAQGRWFGRMEALGFRSREEAALQTLTQDVLKTSEIEGEKLDANQVRSSIARRLGMDIGGAPQIYRDVEGIVEVMLDATRQHDDPMTKERLWNWHAALFPTGRSGTQRITVGHWRTAASGPMQVVSGPFGRERVHFEAPTHNRLGAEMTGFLKWFNASPETDGVIKAGLAHFWFVTIHPFEDGNGRIARALADMTLARTERSSQRFYSMSAQIHRERKEYYQVLESCQRGSLDLSPWISWFLKCLKRSLEASEQTLEAVLVKARFWERHTGESLNQRQQHVLNRLLDGFEGKLTSSKWAKLTKCSQDTALRDITDLVERRILAKESAGGRSTSYALALTHSTSSKMEHH